jgi:hypothetical protein
MEAMLGTKIAGAMILDRDYRCAEECAAIRLDCEAFCDHVVIHKRKEIENFPLVPTAIDRAVAKRISERARRAGIAEIAAPSVSAALADFCESSKSYVQAQFLEARRRYERTHPSGRHEAKIAEITLDDVESRWRDPEMRMDLVSGKDALSALNRHLQDAYQVNVTATAIIDAMRADEIPVEMVALIEMLAKFSASVPSAHDLEPALAT